MLINYVIDMNVELQENSKILQENPCTSSE